MYYLQIVRTKYRIPDAITYLDFAILQYYSLQHYFLGKNIQDRYDQVEIAGCENSTDG